MHKILRILLFSFLIFLLSTTQSVGQSTATPATKISSTLKIFPNPATTFIQLKTATGVNAIVIYNLVGRKIKKFIAEKGKSYPIEDLPKGMYLIQLVDTNDKVLTTQRMSKR